MRGGAGARGAVATKHSVTPAKERVNLSNRRLFELACLNFVTQNDVSGRGEFRRTYLASLCSTPEFLRIDFFTRSFAGVTEIGSVADTKLSADGSPHHSPLTTHHSPLTNSPFHLLPAPVRYLPSTDAKEGPSTGGRIGYRSAGTVGDAPRAAEARHTAPDRLAYLRGVNQLPEEGPSAIRRLILGFERLRARASRNPASGRNPGECRG